ncbi:unnamed protein product [Hymenolepis diminuta]|uniref:DUF7041 domain-containing protein n=1 Tax=Hymenolepis diminuta TaxID=6216 RepID=A0A564YL00_HYMDI|nr:unnamed protein product [Hymenolepis diminuta]
MFQHAFSALPTDVAAEVIDIVDRAPEDNSYDTFKKAVVGRLSDSQEKTCAITALASRTRRSHSFPSQKLKAHVIDNMEGQCHFEVEG